MCWDLLDAWLKWYNAMTGDYLRPRDIKSWDISEYTTRCSSDTLFSILEQPEFWPTVNPIKDSQHYIEKLHNDGYEIYIVTATSYQTLYYKMLRFFELYKIVDVNQIIVCKHKKLLYGGFYTKVLFDAPHNQRFNEKEIGAKRCKTWREVYKFITTEYPI